MFKINNALINVYIVTIIPMCKFWYTVYYNLFYLLLWHYAYTTMPLTVTEAKSFLFFKFQSGFLKFRSTCVWLICVNFYKRFEK